MNSPRHSPLDTSPPDRLAALEARFNDLEARFRRLEAYWLKRNQLATLVWEIVQKLPPPFTATEIRAAILEANPGLAAWATYTRLRTALTQLERQGKIACVAPALGSFAGSFELTEILPAGPRTRRASPQCSRVMATLRTLLPDVPCPFTRSALIGWMKDHLLKQRFRAIKEPSLNMAIHDMVRNGELIIAGRTNGTKYTKSCPLYAIGPKLRRPFGGVKTEGQKAWEEFRAEMEREKTAANPLPDNPSRRAEAPSADRWQQHDRIDLDAELE
jgi:hypothetical protein